MAEEAAGSAFTFKPMDQFLVKPLFGGTEVHWYTITNATLWMAIAVLAITALFVVRNARTCHGADPGTVGGRVVVRLRPQDGRGCGRQGRAQVLSLHLHAVPLYSLREFPGADPDQFQPDLAYRGDRLHGAGRVPDRGHDRLRQERGELPEPVLGVIRAAGVAAGAGDHRVDLVLRAPGQPLGPTCRRRSPPDMR